MGRLSDDENGVGGVCVAPANIVAVRWMIRWRRVIGLLLVADRGGRVYFSEVELLWWPKARSCICWRDWMLFRQKVEPRRTCSRRLVLHKGESDIRLSRIPRMFAGMDGWAVARLNRGLVLLMRETTRSRLARR